MSTSSTNSPVKKTEDMVAYRKQYYNENKEYMHKRSSEAAQRFRLRNIVKKLNEGTYKSKPHLTIKKHGIIFNEEKQLWELPI
mgnify:CR=1 FL=1